MIEKIVSRAASNWTQKGGPYNHVVISSRIRLARNLEKRTMPPFQSEQEGLAVLDKIKNTIDTLDSKVEGLEFYNLWDLAILDRQILLEKHLISPEHTGAEKTRGLIINASESISIMVNEEDHIRIQAICPGLQLAKAWEEAEKIDDLLESELDYAFDQEKGFLTSCLTNVGTGLRASVMVHLPALVMTKQASKIFNALGKLGLIVRGLYGEGTEGTGNIFQISNQITLGPTEQEIIQNLTTVTRQIVEKEEEMRKLLLEESELHLTDKVSRSYGILKHAHIINAQEALNLLSDVRLGSEMGILRTGMDTDELTELIVHSQPGFIQKQAPDSKGSLERDRARAKMIKVKLEMRG